jgi:hypothetical protein
MLEELHEISSLPGTTAAKPLLNDLLLRLRFPQ